MGREDSSDTSIFQYVLLSALVFLHAHILLDVFDGAMVILAMYALNIFNPGMLLYCDSAAGAGRRTDKVVVERGEK